jgi:prefoldin subunit 1
MAADGSGGRQVDMELKKAFQELQSKMIATSQQLKVSDAQIEQLRRQVVHAHLVEKEISNLPKETKTYEGVGRMFILKPLSTIEQNLADKVKACEEKVKVIEASKVYLERSIKEGEENLRELILHKKREQAR